jgi:flagellar hook protein FlgE
MDLAISGNGFFITQTPTGTAYTRNGQFQVDKDGFVVNNGDKLMGWGPDKDSNPVKMREGELQPLKVDTSMIAPLASDGGTAAAKPRKISLPTQLDSRLPVIASAFNVDDPTTYNNSTSGTLYDSLGNPLTLTTYYKKTGQDQWDVYARINNPNMPTVSTTGSGSAANNPVMLSGGGTVAGTGVTVTPVNLSFNTDGSLASPTDGFAAFGTYGSIAGANPLVVTLDIGTSKDVGTTQFARTFSNKGFDQVGYAAAELTGLQVDKTGIMKARYSNGKTKDIGQVVLSNFKNPQGLQAIGANRWIETLASGSSILNNPGSSNVGLVQSGAVEDSNVDLTSELVNMITAQRFYQANAQTIKVQDAVMQTLINLR